jgi:RNase P/RNase MRP subunit POP5
MRLKTVPVCVAAKVLPRTVEPQRRRRYFEKQIISEFRKLPVKSSIPELLWSHLLFILPDIGIVL